MKRTLLPIAFTLVAALCASACGIEDGSDKAVVDEAAIVPAAASLLPTKIQDAGVLRVGASYQTAPMTFLTNDGQDKDGISHELATLAIAKLGVRPEFQVIPFPGQVAALDADKVDLIWETTSITPERLEAGSFVEFAKLAYGVLVLKGNPAELSDLSSFCGRRIGVPQGSIFQEYVESASSECKSSAEPAISILTYKGPPEGRLAVRSGNADAFLGGHANNLYYAQESEEGEVFDAVEVTDIKPTPIGVQLRKEDTALAEAVAESINASIADGSYARVFQKYELAGMQMASAKIAE